MLDACWVSNPPFASDKLKDRSLPHSTGKVVCDDDVLLSKVQFGHRIRLLNQIKLCQKEKNVYKARRIHAQIIKKNLIAKDAYIASALITTYAKCGSLEKAEEVFWKLPERNVVPWSALISGYSQNGLGHEALKCFRQMQDAGISPNVVTYVSVLKACGIMGCLEIGEDIEYDVIRQGLLQKHIILAIAFVDMYSKCGALDKAQRIFQQMPVQNVVSWNALIRGYIQYGLGNEALNCFAIMQYEGVQPDVVTYVYILKACGIVRSITLGEDIDAEVRKQGLLQQNVELGNALVDMYSKCGVLQKAQEVFEQILIKNLVSWNIIITGYTQNGLGDGALQCFKKMQVAGVSPDAITYVNLLKACGIVGSLVIGEKINAEIRNQGLLYNDFFLGTALVDMYSKCGKLDKAREVFENLPMQNVVMWSALIGGYVRNGLSNEALKCFTQMQDVGVHPDAVTYAHILKACGNVGSLDIGEDVDAHVRKRKLLQRDIVLGNALIDMYCKCGAIEKAREVFVDLPKRDVVTWSALISGYAQNGFCDKALEAFRQMQDVGIIPDARTYVCILKACSIVQSLEIGEDIDTKVRKQGLLQKDVVLGTALMDMYCKCGALEKAREVFDQLPAGNVVAWSAIIAGYAQNGLGDEALKCFSQMQDARVRPDDVTYLSVLKACGIVGSLKVGEDIDTEVRKKGALQNNVVLGTALVDMYAKCSRIAKAQEVLENLPCRDIVSWNALLSGYSQEGRGHEALNCFEHMQREGLFPNEFSFSCILKACGSIGAIAKGIQVHNEIANRGLLDQSVVLGNSLVDMYAKCGAPAKARQVLKSFVFETACLGLHSLQVMLKRGFVRKL